MKFKAKCKHRYQDCISFDCSNICKREPKTHPYCTFKSFCDFTGHLCDGHCKYNKREYEIKDIQNKLHRLINSKELLEALINNMSFEKKELEKLQESYKKTHEFTDEYYD